MNKLKARLKELRKQDNLSQKKLAALIGTTEYSIYSWEVGRAEPSVDFIIALAKTFEVSTDYLLGITEEKLLNYENGRSALPIDVLFKLYKRGINPTLLVIGKDICR